MKKIEDSKFGLRLSCLSILMLELRFEMFWFQNPLFSLQGARHEKRCLLTTPCKTAFSFIWFNSIFGNSDWNPNSTDLCHLLLLYFHLSFSLSQLFPTPTPIQDSDDIVWADLPSSWYLILRKSYSNSNAFCLDLATPSIYQMPTTQNHLFNQASKRFLFDVQLQEIPLSVTLRAVLIEVQLQLCLWGPEWLLRSHSWYSLLP